jgi:Leucine-rich repeat (LRR) protein
MPEEEPQPTNAVLGGMDAEPRPYDAVLGGNTKYMILDEPVRRIDQTAKKKFTELDLSGLGLEKLPPEIGNWAHLTGLNLSGNQITCIPQALGYLFNPAWLDLSGN